MSGCKCNIGFIIVLASLFSVQASSQQINYGDSLPAYNASNAILKPSLHYSVGSSFLFVPHMGSVAGITLSPFLSVPLTPKLSVEGGIIAGRYYSAFRNLNQESEMNGAFAELSVYGSASYHFNPQFTLYGTGIKQLAGTSPFNPLPKSSYTIGSNYNFGSFSIGVALQMSNWNTFSSFPFNGSEGFFSPFEQRHGTFGTFGR